jgi:Periplasmic binding protein
LTLPTRLSTSRGERSLRLGVLTIRSGRSPRAAARWRKGSSSRSRSAAACSAAARSRSSSATPPASRPRRAPRRSSSSSATACTCWPPIVTPDYAPFIAQLKTNVDAIYAGFGPTNGQRFLKQYSEFGLKLPVLGMVTTTEESSLKSMDDEALGVITARTYSAAIDTPTNRKWVQAMRAEYKDNPS